MVVVEPVRQRRNLRETIKTEYPTGAGLGATVVATATNEPLWRWPWWL